MDNQCLRRCLTVVMAVAGLAVWAAAPAGAASPAARENDVRPAILAGAWYPADPAELAREVDRRLREAPRPAHGGRAVALVAPHAGHVYSGGVAAAAWAEAKAAHPSTIILVGPSHRFPLERPSVWTTGAYECPLGRVEVNAPLARHLSRSVGGVHEARAHRNEHCLEIQLPFIMRALPGADLVPVLTGPPSWEEASRLGHVMAGLAREGGVLPVSSTDLSHFHNRADARTLDDALVRRVLSLDPDGLWQDHKDGKVEACGLNALLSVMLAAKELGATRGVVLSRADSGDVTGDTGQVVGYLAAAFLAPPLTAKAKGGQPGPLNPEEQNTIRDLAQRSVEAAARGEAKPRVPEAAFLQEEGRVFVTLKKAGELRGCIGNPWGGMTLGRAVVDMARAAALDDPRFPPLGPDELSGLSLEVSYLTAPRPITAGEVRVGRDGLIIDLNGRRGLLLPQVPVELGWDKETYLEGLCRKAGLPRGAWKRPETKLLGFRAQVF